jgi:hypothetical protein
LANCDSNGGADGSLGLNYSTDNGQTWTHATTPLTTSGGANSFQLRAFGELADGTLIILYQFGPFSTLGKNNHYCAASHDGGVTWSNLSTSPSNPLAVPWVAGTNFGTIYGSIRQDSSGNIYVPAYANVNNETVYILKCPTGSAPTNGSTWTTQGSFSDGVHNLSETDFVMVTATNWVAISRNDTSSGDGDLYITQSTNSGVTWGTPTRMNMPGTRTPNQNAVSPQITALASGNYLVSWCARYGTGNPVTVPVLAALVTDGFASTTWLDRPPAVTYLNSGNGRPYDFGYPWTVQRADGKIVLAYYYETGTANLCNVASVIFDEDWAANSGNTYAGCQSTTGWTSVGADCTVSTTHTLGGATNALKFDDNTATHTANANWPITTNVASSTNRLGMVAWRYHTAVSATMNNVVEFMDLTPTRRAQEELLGSTGHMELYNGSVHVDTGISIPLNQWVRESAYIAFGSNTVTGNLVVNNGTPYALSTSATAGNPIASLLVQAGSLLSQNASTFWLGALYTHQYVASIPTVSVGNELNYVPPPVIVSSPVTQTPPINVVTLSGRAVIAGIIATGIDQTTAYRLGPRDLVAQVVSVPNGGGVTLPSFRIGSEVFIRNDDPSNALAIYPMTGGTINNLAVNAPYSLSAAASVTLHCVAPARWVS